MAVPGEVLGGPTAAFEHHGGHPHMIRSISIATWPRQNGGVGWVVASSAGSTKSRMPGDPEFASSAARYLSGAISTAGHGYHEPPSRRELPQAQGGRDLEKWSRKPK